MKTYPLPCTNTKAEAIVLANGEFPTHIVPLSILSDNSFIVCCDGAIDELSHTHIEVHAIVGDCDSLSTVNKEKYKNILHQIREQDTNDLTKSIRFCVENQKKQVIILGATGKREDHSIANISLLAEYIEFVDDISIITNHGIFNAISTPSQFQSFEGQQVSLFCIAPTEITTRGLKYPIEKRVFTNWWQATLNESVSDTFDVDTNNKVIIFRAFP